MKKTIHSKNKKQLLDVRHYPIRPHIGVGGLILWNNSILLVKRKYDPDANLWAIPGGHLDLGEKCLQGALRECQEETGLDLNPGKLASVIDKIDYDHEGTVEYHYVLCDYWMILSNKYSLENPPIPTPKSDALDAKFVPFDELMTYDLTKTVIELFRNLKYIP